MFIKQFTTVDSEVVTAIVAVSPSNSCSVTVNKLKCHHQKVEVSTPTTRNVTIAENK